MERAEFQKYIDGEIFKVSMKMKKEPKFQERLGQLRILKQAFNEGRVIFPLRAVEANDIFIRAGLASGVDLQRGTIKGYEYLIVSDRQTRMQLLRSFPKCTFDHWFER